MFCFASLFLSAFLFAALAEEAGAQKTTPTASPSPTVSPSPSASPTAALVDRMGLADLQQVVQLLKSNYIDPAALNETELNRAMLSGVLARLGRGVMLLPAPAPDVNEATDPFYDELIENHIGYFRLGALTPANLQALDAALQKYAGKKIEAVVLDLRASEATNDFATAAQFANRFVEKGKPLFSLRKTGGKPGRAFVSESEAVYQGLVIVLVDEDTAGPAEAVAGVLRLYTKALLIGEPTAGRAVEFSDLPLNEGRILRTAVGEAVLPEGRPLFPEGLKPDVPVELAEAEKRQIFELSVQSGMAPFVFEKERPHLNEAALMSGRNPEIDSMEASQRRKGTEKAMPRDLVLQRAVDIVTSLAIYQKK